MKASAFFIAVLLIVSCSSSVIMGVNYHEDHCHDFKDCFTYCKRYVPEPRCIKHICDCTIKSLSTNDEIPTSASSSHLNK
ncbi:PREDICTED: defensin-like protein 308 [Camelina sativa]|uniref:Defensin-like protein 308 n=1 Tax=Camelina sativa TaxID=90675 RepID=A0ABM1QMP5_CAMSA|nr:PREDICTED: defensin-like protein 308 [Camelina sativa]